MCFSAQASFTSSAVITAIGIATLTRVKEPKQVLFGAIPIIFGIQQCAEGVLWTTLKSGAHQSLQNTAMYVFLITALVIWPVMISLSTLFLETKRIRRTILTGLLMGGGLLSLFYAWCLVFYNVRPEIQSFHMDYINNFPSGWTKAAFVLYLAVTITPLFVSSVKRMRLFGGLIAVSCLVTGIFYAQYLTSVWCFFAAVISMAIFWILAGMKSAAEQPINN
jgi:hypothetical protein